MSCFKSPFALSTRWRRNRVSRNRPVVSSTDLCRPFILGRAHYIFILALHPVHGIHREINVHRRVGRLVFSIFRNAVNRNMHSSTPTRIIPAQE